jgi:hypothetical protein
LIGDFPKLVELTPCGHRSEKNSISTELGLKIKFETMQTIEETLFALQKNKRKKCSKQLTKYPFKKNQTFL